LPFHIFSPKWYRPIFPPPPGGGGIFQNIDPWRFVHGVHLHMDIDMQHEHAAWTRTQTRTRLWSWKLRLRGILIRTKRSVSTREQLHIGEVSLRISVTTTPTTVDTAILLVRGSSYTHEGQLQYQVQPHLRVMANTCEAQLTRLTYTYEEQFHHEVQRHLRGTATPTRYSDTYEVQLHLRGTATPTRYSYTYEVQRHLRGTATPPR
jgi:hypothetical protein